VIPLPNGSGLNYWEYLIDKLNVVFIYKTVSVPPGQETLVYEEVGRGFWIGGGCLSNVADSGLRWNLDGTEVKDSISSIYQFGLTSPNNFFFYVTKYDTTNNIYAMAWSPSYPGTFRFYSKVYAFNDATTTATMTVFGYFAKVVGEER